MTDNATPEWLIDYRADDAMNADDNRPPDHGELEPIEREWEREAARSRELCHRFDLAIGRLARARIRAAAFPSNHRYARLVPRYASDANKLLIELGYTRARDRERLIKQRLRGDVRL
jgi:hypothetical protein